MARHQELRQAVVDLRRRGLCQSSLWAAEMLQGLDPDTSGQVQRAQEEAEDDLYLLARGYFDLKAYRRCAHALSAASGSVALFLRCYATYIAGERLREQRRAETDKDSAVVTCNEELKQLEKELAAAAASSAGDAFCTFLYGLVLSDLSRPEDAAAALATSVTSYPCNRDAWAALAKLAQANGGVLPGQNVSLPSHWMREVYSVNTALECQENSEALSRLQDLAEQFPRSEWVITQAALAQYNLRNFDEAQELFEDLLARDPHRIEAMDTYSNILYVKEQFVPLSHLAHRAMSAAKFTPETCCIVGNYYSLKGMHEQAVTYFRRALKLDRNYLSAWTLMGHEFVEMKNSPAAVDAYRKAVDLNGRDYRAWYGLGQTYELLHMPFYALHYYRQATQLRPHDARMWCAMGQCYENDQLNMHAAAIRCYRRALANGDREGIALHKLAQLHHRQGDRDSAAQYHQQNLQRIDAAGLQGTDAVDALICLAVWHKDRAEFAAAEAHAMRLLDYDDPARERGKALLAAIRSLQASPGGLSTPGGAQPMQTEGLESPVEMEEATPSSSQATPAQQRAAMRSPAFSFGL